MISVIFAGLIQFGFIALVLWAMVDDYLYLRIPNAVSILLVLLFFLFALHSLPFSDWLVHLGAFALVLLGGFLLFYFNLFGGGDVKFLSATALWVGLDDLPLFIVCVSLFGGLLAVILIFLRFTLSRFLPRLQKTAQAGFLSLKSGAPMPYGVAIGSGVLFVQYLAIDKLIFN